MNWQKIWEGKGKILSQDLKLLDGFEDTTADPKEIAEEIIRILDIKPTDKVLEVGCGAGMLAQYIAPKCHYHGVDYSESLLEKHKKILGNTVEHGEACKLPFETDSFDKVFAYSVFHYFPDKGYIRRAFVEMLRVCTGPIFIGDLPMKSHRKEHLLFTKDNFEGEITKGFHNKNRFNVLIK